MGMRISVGLGLAVFLGLSGVGEAVVRAGEVLAQRSEKRDTLEFEGRLDESSPTFEEGRYFTIHIFEGKAGETIVIESTSDDFDVYLLLLDPDANRIGDASNSPVVVTLPVAGVYAIGVTTKIAEEVGNYRMIVRSASPEDLQLAEAQQLSQQVLQLNQQGKYDEAVPLAERALAIRRKILGEEHPDVATGLNNLAALYENQGRYAEAEPLYQQALELHQYLLGKDHLDFALSLNNLAGLYESQGKYMEAEPLYQQALELRIERQLTCPPNDN